MQHKGGEINLAKDGNDVAINGAEAGFSIHLHLGEALYEPFAHFGGV
jgi:hypothetical protein